MRDCRMQHCAASVSSSEVRRIETPLQSFQSERLQVHPACAGFWAGVVLPGWVGVDNAMFVINKSDTEGLFTDGSSHGRGPL